MTTQSPLQWSVIAYFGTLPLPTSPQENFTTPSTTIATNISHSMNDTCIFLPQTENYITIISFCIIFCLSVIGNSIVVVVIIQQRTMRSITNIYLLNLAISDLMLSVICMPPTLVSSVINCWMFGDLLCKLFAYLQPVVVTASAYTLAVIAIERYYAICRPLHSRVWQTRSHAYAMISVVWIISVFANFLMLFLYHLQKYGENGLMCAPKYHPIVHFGYQIYMTSVLLLIPLGLMVVLYGSVIRSLKLGMKMDIAAVDGFFDPEGSVDEAENDLRKLNGLERIRSTLRIPYRTVNQCKEKKFAKQLDSPNSMKSDPSKDSRKGTFSSIKTTGSSGPAERNLRSTHSEKAVLAKQRVIRMLIVIVIIFFCCWTPSYIWWLLLVTQDSFHTFDVWNSHVNTGITVLCYISSCTNPITYCFMNKKFRTALLLSFGCQKRTIRHHFQKVYIPNGPPNIMPTPYNEINNGRVGSFSSQRNRLNDRKLNLPPPVRSSSMCLRERPRICDTSDTVCTKLIPNEAPAPRTDDETVELVKSQLRTNQAFFNFPNSVITKKSFESHF